MVLVLACGRGPAGVEAVGTIEIVETSIAPMVPARVVRLAVDEGAAVSAGDTLVWLAQTTLPSDIEQRRARLAAAEAALRELERGPRPAEIEKAEAELRAAEAEAARTARDVERLTALQRSGGISEQELDAARAAAALAESRRRVAVETLGLLREGTRRERIQAARAEVASARAALAAAQATAGDLVLTAPVSGVVLERHVQPGEVVSAGTPTLTLGEVDRPWVRVFVSPAVLAGLRLGQPATATVDGMPGRRFPGRIVAIASRAEFTPRVALTEDERADLLFGVKVELTDTTGTLKAGLPATVRLEPAVVASSP